VKHLLLVRHAKSSWEHPELGDFDRPLNKRGIRDAPGMGEYLARQDILPDTIVTSPARRARETTDAFAYAMKIPIADIREDGRIYAASVSTLLEVICGWDEAWSSVMMAGHNPGMADIAALLIGGNIGHVPTCAVLELGLDVASWRDVAPGCGALRFRSSPKSINSP